MRGSTTAAVCTVLLALASGSQTPAFAQTTDPPVSGDPIPEATPDAAVRDSFAIRLGFLGSWLFDSNQGRPFFYLDAGLRYKTDDYYVDLKLPAFVAGIDWVFNQVQGLLGVNQPFNLFEAANDPIHYAAFLEPGHLRLGQTFLTHLPGGAPLRLTGGIFALVDFVFFDLALFNRDPEDFNDVADPDANDPFVLAPGGFVAVGGDAPLSEWDLALGVGPDVYQDDNYVPNNGLVLFADLELEIDPLEDVGGYIRTRFSTYTHTSPLVFTMTFNFGVVLRLL